MRMDRIARIASDSATKLRKDRDHRRTSSAGAPARNIRWITCTQSRASRGRLGYGAEAEIHEDFDPVQQQVAGKLGFVEGSQQE